MYTYKHFERNAIYVDILMYILIIITVFSWMEYIKSANLWNDVNI